LSLQLNGIARAMAATGAVVSGPQGLTPEAMDAVLARMETDFRLLKSSRGSLARSLKERELVYSFGLARHLMMSVLSCDSGDRKLLNAIFGGDCTRVSRVRAVLESVVLAQADERLHSCMSACTSVEKVLCDLGFSRALRVAQTAQREALVSGKAHPNASEVMEKPAAIRDSKVTLTDRSPLAAEKPLSPMDKVALTDRSSLVVEKPLSPIAETQALGEEAEQATDEEADVKLVPMEIPISVEQAKSVVELQAVKESAGEELNHSPEVARKALPAETSSWQIKTSQAVEENAAEELNCSPEVACKAPPAEPSSWQVQTPQAAEENAAEEFNRSLEVACKAPPAETSSWQENAAEQFSRSPEVACQALPAESHQAREPTDPTPDNEDAAPTLSEPLLPGRVLAESQVVLREINPVASSVRSSSSPARASKPWRTKRAAGKSNMRLKEKVGHAVAIEASDVAATPPDPAQPQHSGKSFMLLSLEHQQLIRQLYAHYVGPGGMYSGAGLTLSKFRRFLRHGRMLSTDMCGIGTGSATPTAGTDSRMLRHLTPAREMLTKPDGVDSSQLSQTEADLILVRAAGEDGQATTNQRLYTAEAFGQALEQVALHYRPAWKPLEALEDLCRHVLVPLGEQVLKIGDADVRAAVSVLSDAEVAGLMKRNVKALTTIFACYATGIGAPEPYRRGHWTAQTTIRFASEAGIAGDVSHEKLKQLFCSCAAYESACGRGEKDRISFAGFQLSLVVLGQSIHTSKTEPSERLSFLFFRLGTQLRVGMQLHNRHSAHRSAAPKGLR